MLSVIIVNYNSGHRLARCLDHLSRQSFRDFEILIFDNASTDESLALAAAATPDARIMRSAANLGFAAANNRAAQEARGGWLVFLNPDAYAETDWLTALDAATRTYPGVDAFGSTQLDAADASRVDGAGDVLHVLGIAYRGHFGGASEKLPDEGECLSPCAAAAMYRKAAFDALGGFDERFFCYGEDVDLGLRLRLAGGRTVQLRSARVHHEGSGVTGRHSDFSVYHGHRNRIWLVRKNFPGLLFWGGLPFRILTDGLLLARLAALGRFRAGLRALLDGHFGGGPIRASACNDRRTRRISLAAFAAMLAWSPSALVARRAKVWSVDPSLASPRRAD